MTSPMDGSSANRQKPISCIEGDYCALGSAVQLPNGSEIRQSKTLAVLACRCRSQWCPDCAESHMVQWREKLRPVVQQWGDVSMITLTIDPKRWKGPEEAYLGIQAKRSVVRFIEKLLRRGLIASKEFFYAIEFHKSGWVHWHVAVNAKRVIKSDKYKSGQWGITPEFKAETQQLSALWGHGFAQVNDGGMMSPEHAMNYLTKYIAKQDVGPPGWVLDRHGNFRKFSTSRGLCGTVKSRPEPSENPKTYERMTPRQRVKKCQKQTKVVEILKTEVVRMGGTDTFKRYRYKRLLDVPWAEIRDDKNLLAVALEKEFNASSFATVLIDGRTPAGAGASGGDPAGGPSVPRPDDPEWWEFA